MIRMVQINSAQHAKSYFNDSLNQSDYYLNDQELPGQFGGRIVQRLGLETAINRDVFQLLCDNINPITGKTLTPRQKQNRRVGYDINFHCPKSVSVLHVLSKDNHILNLFRESVTETMQDIEADAQTRVRKGENKNSRNNRTTGELLYAQFLHQTARPLAGIEPDMHLHTHVFTLNLTWDHIEQRYKAGEFGNIKRDLPYYQARFHKNLSDKLIGLGYRIRQTDSAFEVEGIPQAVIDLFSKRSNEIGQVAKDLGITNPAELDKLGSRTRAKKQKGLSMTELKKAWRDQIYALGMYKQDDGKTIIRYAQQPESSPLTAKNCIDHALKQRFERASVFQDRRILETAYRFATGDASVGVEQIDHAFANDCRIIKIREQDKMLCTTKEVLAEERYMVTLAQSGKGSMRPLYTKMPSLNLNGEQAEAVIHILTTPDAVSIIQGRAGTGKTTLMKDAVTLIEKSGRSVIVVAPTAEASHGVLRQEGFQEADTVAKLLVSPALQAKLKNNVLWIDEAGLLGVKDMTTLLTLARERNARLILSGDTRQHSSVVRGDALRILSSIAGIQSANVSKIYRQRRTDYREAVQALSLGNAKQGFDKLHAMGAIRVVDPMHPSTEIVENYITTVKKGSSALVISPTHKDGERVTAAIRDRLRQDGLIGQREYTVLQLVNCNLTEAEKQDCRNYQAGQVIQFNKDATGIKRGSVWTVANITNTTITLIDKTGHNVSAPLEQADRFDLFLKKEIGLSIGDKLRITRNGQDNDKKRLNNGQSLDVVSIEKDDTIVARNAISKVIYKLPADYGHVAHAHCVTSHASQGKTVDEVFIYQPSGTFTATNLKQFYVSVSRGRDAAHIYTDDIAELLAHASGSGDRQSALELVKRKALTLERADQLVRHPIPVQKADKGETVITQYNARVRSYEPEP